MQLDQLLNQRQPDAAPLMGATLGVFDPVKPLEQPGHFVGATALATAGMDWWDTRQAVDQAQQRLVRWQQALQHLLLY